jgi:hypothetical protein
MNTLLKLFIFLLLLLGRSFAIAAQNPSRENSIQLIPEYKPPLSLYMHNIARTLQRVAPTEYEHPLLHPCEPFAPTNVSIKEFYGVEKHWLNKGRKKALQWQQQINAVNGTLPEQLWVEQQATPRLTFMWSLLELAKTTQKDSAGKDPSTYAKFQLKHATAHAFARIVGYQKEHQLKLKVQSPEKLQTVRDIRILLIRTKVGDFLPLILLNTPKYLYEANAEDSKSILKLWDALKQNRDVLCCDPLVQKLFSPAQEPNMIDFSEVTRIVILPTFDNFEIPSHISAPVTTLLQQAWDEFQNACVQFAVEEEKLQLSRLTRQFPPPPGPIQRNTIGL